MCLTMYRNLHTLQYTGTPCPRTVTGFCRCFAFQIGKTCGHNSIIRNFQFRKFLPIKSNFTAYYTTGISLFPLTFPPISTKLKIQKQILLFIGTPARMLPP